MKSLNGVRWIALLLALAPAAMSAETQNGYLKNPDKAPLQAQIVSFTDLARDLHAANQSDDSTACGKLEMVWDRIEGTAQQPDALYAPESDFKDVVTFGNGSALRFWKIFSGWTKFDWAGSKAKDSDFYGSEIRPYREGHLRDTVRLTHRFGVNVKMSYVPLEGAAQLGLTGQYATRNDCVLGRLSSAVPTSVKERFTPAIAAKFFVDGASESQVLIAQHDIGGQSFEKDAAGQPIIDNNFYSKYLSNRLSFEKGNLSGVGAFSRFFYTAQYFSRHILGLNYIFDPRELQANHLAEMNVNGQKVENPKGPRFVWMVPPSAATKEMFRQKAQSDLDFRRHFLALNGSLELGQAPIFLVYGSDTWTYEPETEATLIGKLVVNSDFVVSEAADVRLFYKHAIQFQKIPDAVGETSPYTHDYAFSEWKDELFTSDCALGIQEKEVWPLNLVAFRGKESLYPSLNFSQGSLEGTFLVNATVNPASVRLSRNHEWCLAKFVEKKLKADKEKKDNSNPLVDMFKKL
ncbi:MAG TPA: hypothetical protein VE954_31005 [Oligoflexus sp.]|uniref:hypothetical protein n=1 Tax=Oligoflexus sp. TaxID=1971216 RepID=UPI002D3D68F5|nr:hypothetical protein [Oligoflexus sp.]HYX37554.1 hypothetical protein [Oligoflexus sp.]